MNAYNVATTNTLTAKHSVAQRGVRVCGYLIDILPIIPLSLVGWIPIVGPMMVGAVLTPYWLLRDVTGASLGKFLLHEKVVGKDGQAATVGTRIMRNVPLAIGPACLIIPLLGYFWAPLVSFIFILIEGILLLTSGERLGDRMAGTAVIQIARD